MRHSKRAKKLFALSIVLLSITVGYAALSTTLKINGSAVFNKNTWNIYWDDPVVSKGSVSNVKPTITNDSTDQENTKLIWNVDLDIGDFYEFTVYAVNNGSIDAMITDIESSTNEELPSYIKLDITVAGGADKGTIAYNWTQASSNLDEWYFFSRNNKVIGTLDDMPSGKKSSTRLKWLVKNTTANSISGATSNAWGSSNGGYWTLTPVSNDATHAWSIGGSSYEPYNGNMGAYYVGNPEIYGLRPVITIPKSILTN